EDRTSFNYPDDVESFEQMGERLSSFLQDLLYSERDEHVLIVTHGIALRVLLSLLLSGDTTQTDYFPSLKNASVTRVEIENGKVKDLKFEPLK
ncbi:MAG: histidine phosphatase family protein, partial [Bacteroidales bacterium]